MTPTRRWLRRQRDGRRRDRSRGAALMEAALVAPIFFVLVFGVLEFGFAFHARLTAQNMSQVGARSGSGAGDDPGADFRILQAVENARSTVPRGRITHIVVYEATGPDDSVPPGCLNSSVGDRCNRYTGASLALDEDDFGCGPGDVDGAWCPIDREVAVNGPPDYLGVYVRIRHDLITGFFGDEFVFETDTVMRLEPRRLQ